MNIFKKSASLAQIYFHEIKNKLGSIKLSLSLLKNKKISEEEKNILIEGVMLTINKAIDILHDYIDMEKYKKEKFLKNEKIYLNALIKEIIDELSLDIKRKEAEVKIVSSENLFIIANRKWLKKAILNIIHNAVKYNKQKGKVFIHLIPEKHGVLLIIKDTGIGMSEEEKRKIFTKYFTSGKEYGTGLGLNMSKAVIESFGGAISVKSEKNKGTVFYLYLPKSSKRVKIKKLSAILSGFVLLVFFSASYFFCIFPQKITKIKSGDLIIYKIQNGVVATAGINDEITIIARKNLFGTKTRTEFFLKKADINVNTHSKPIKVVANGLVLKNLGTKFETVTNKKKSATSVYFGKILAKNSVIPKNKGLIYENGKISITPLPPKVSGISVKETKNEICVSWNSKLNDFSLTFSKDPNFQTPPIYKYRTSKHEFCLNDVSDGYWIVKIQSVKNGLYSLPKTKKFLALLNYEKALKAYKDKNFPLAQSFLTASLQSVKNDSYKPYLLEALLLLKNEKYEESLKFAKKSYNLKKNAQTACVLGNSYYLNGKYEKSVKILEKNKTEKCLDILAFDYYKLKNYEKAQKYLLEVLEKNPKNKKALKYLIKILKAKKERFLLNIFENQYKGLK